MCYSDGSHDCQHHPSHHRRPLPERGWIQFLLLRLLDEAPMHGYRLMDELESRGYVRSGRFETGSIYTILRRMERHGLLLSTKGESESGRVRRIYRITSMGQEALRRGLENIIRRKKMMDELADYYRERFMTNSADQSHKPDSKKREER